MSCPRCGLGYYRSDRDGFWMCYACGFTPYDSASNFAAFFLLIVIVVWALSRWVKL